MMIMLLLLLLQKAKDRLCSVYQNLNIQEISGSLGDLGTLLPLTVALSSQRSISLAPALFFAGLANVITGLVWDIPMCVQPMKSIAAVALSEGWEAGRVTAAGIWMGILLIVLGATSLIEIVNKIVPIYVVSGLQIGVGIRLATKGINMVAKLGWLDTYDCVTLGVLCAILSMYFLREDRCPDGRTRRHLDDDDHPGDGTTEPSTAAAAAAASEEEEVRNPSSVHSSRLIGTKWLKCPCNMKQRHPVGLYLFLIGACLASVTLITTNNENNQYDLPLRFFGAPVAIWAVDSVTADDWKYGFLEGALPQLPLSTLNSVISVCALAHALYPEKRTRASSDATSKDTTVVKRKEVAVSVGIMNLLFCPFGSMPNCHGAGGLAGQHRLGARHGASMVFLGFAKMLVAVFLGGSVLTILDAFPDAVLGVMLVISGQELATTGLTILVENVVEEKVLDKHGDMEEIALLQKEKWRILRRNAMIALVTAIVIIATGETHFGALSGLTAHFFHGEGFTDLQEWIRCKRKGSSCDYGQVASASFAEDDEEGSSAMTSDASNDEKLQRDGYVQGSQMNLVI